jgi:oligopeptide transport system substrate-binding protein
VKFIDTHIQKLMSNLRNPVLLLLPLFLFLGAGCGRNYNNPNIPPLQEARSDGTPWVVSYRSLPDDPRTLDPQVSYDTLGHSVIAQVYECLLQYHPFKTDPYELTPALAETMPRRVRNPDGTEYYEVRIKPGIMFHDDPCFPGGKGRELIANDFAFVLKRIADPKVECPVVSTLQEYIVGLKEAYAAAQQAGKFDYSKPAPGIEIVDRHTFKLHLTKPYPQIMYWLAMPFMAPVPHEAVEYYDGRTADRNGVRPQFKFHPVGTGPFVLNEWRKGRLMRLVRHPAYHATKFPMDGWSETDADRFAPLAGKPLPFLDEIQFTLIREYIPRWVLFRQGYVDSVGVNKDTFGTVVSVGQELTAEYKKKGVELHKDNDPSTYFLIFNMEDPVLGKNRKLRQAISSAYDVALENELFFNGIFIPAQQLLPPGVFGHQNQLKNPYRQNDLEKARILLEEAGYPNGIDRKSGQRLKITLDITADSPEDFQHAEFQKNQIEKLGIQVQVVENIWARQQEKVDKGNFQIVAYGWHADYPDPENFFFLFITKNHPPQGSNGSRYSDPEFDRLFDQMTTMDNTPERLEIIKKMNAILTEDCPFVLLNHPVGFAMTQPWARRTLSNPLLAGGLKYASVNTTLREEKRLAWNQPVLWPLWVGAGAVPCLILLGLAWQRRQRV